MKRPTQSVFIREEGKTYAFDAVIKLETQTSLKIAEQASDVSNKSHVNYAITQPNQIQLEVAVSDTVTVSNEPLTKGSGKRSLLAHQCLIAMQRRRNLLTVITPSYTFTKMLIESITQEASDDYQDGEFHASIVFKEMTVVPKKKKKTTKTKEVNKTLGTTQTNKTVLAQMADTYGFSSGSTPSNSTKGDKLEASISR